MTELKAGQELNFQVAEEVMGWIRLSQFYNGSWVWWLDKPEIAGYAIEGEPARFRVAQDGDSPLAPEHYSLVYIPDYSRDIALALEVEAKIDELGLKHVYVQSLTFTLFGRAGADDYTAWNYYEMSSEELWDMVHATPEQRCIAALMAKSDVKTLDKPEQP